VKDSDLRRKAALFYLRPCGLTGEHDDWIDGRSEDGIDADVLSLYALLRDVTAAERERIAKLCDKEADDYTNACALGLAKVFARGWDGTLEVG
jgi:hypothetical protein